MWLTIMNQQKHQLEPATALAPQWSLWSLEALLLGSCQADASDAPWKWTFDRDGAGRPSGHRTRGVTGVTALRATLSLGPFIVLDFASWFASWIPPSTVTWWETPEPNEEPTPGLLLNIPAFFAELRKLYQVDLLSGFLHRWLSGIGSSFGWVHH